MLLLVLAFLIRLPFFYSIVISWDESTFILMGQELLDGRLPYTELWDLKPPLAYVVYAAAIALFGPNIEGVRVAGALCVFATGLAIWLVCRKTAGAFVAGLIAVAAMTSAGAVTGGQATLTEHFVIALVCWALVLLARPELNYRNIALAGLLLSAATLIRTNVVYVVVAVGFALIVRPGRPLAMNRVREVCAFGGGGLPLLVLCLVPFLLTGNLDLLYRSLVVAPLAYATTQLSGSEAVVKLADSVLRPGGLPLLGILMLGLAGSAKMCWRLVRTRRVSSLEYWTLVFIAGGTLSVAQSGAGHSHYLIQIVPLYAVGALSIMSRDAAGSWIPQRLASTVLAAGVIVAMVSVTKGYAQLAQRVWQHEPVRTGRALAVAAFLEAHNPQREPVFLMEDHISYWLTHTRPLTRMSTHPSNLTKGALIRAVEGSEATPQSEFERVFDQAPRYVIKSSNPWYMEGSQQLRRWLDRELQTNYRLVARVETLDVYQRRTNESVP